MESLLTQRVHNILQPVLGNDRYKAEGRDLGCRAGTLGRQSA